MGEAILADRSEEAVIVTEILNTLCELADPHFDSNSADVIRDLSKKVRSKKRDRELIASLKSMQSSTESRFEKLWLPQDFLASLIEKIYVELCIDAGVVADRILVDLVEIVEKSTQNQGTNKVRRYFNQ